MSFTGEYYDGQSSMGIAVTLSFDTNTLFVRNDTLSLDVPFDALHLDPQVGTSRSIIYLHKGGEIHSSDHDALNLLERSLPHKSPERIARRLESKLLYAVAALILTVSIIAGFLRYGLPEIARYAANHLPPSTEEQIGSQALSSLDQLYLNKSTLSQTRQSSIRSELADFCRRTECPQYRLLFRNSTSLGANAFALPGHTVVITDQLIEKSHNDEEILAVLSHELGHIRYNHILRTLLQSMGSGVVLVVITGDISNFSDLAAGLPAVLLQQGYSRDMEDEADTYALHSLQNARISPQRFADILTRIDTKGIKTATLFSSHPDTQKRIQAFIRAAEKH
ncbi:M48 family metallopeptidase [Sulfuricurvum sp.]|uniref:M48 family metallopeptidase n=1 Tax=Sulfuricurvum sp. TaxID=2025608 RepID=UPI00263053B3|nr:M48 family metallopeptidase [Sulfuricurvum sp.]MDD3598106.1 M48 family metallopeptidase [Sulfuricurvum sp.]